MGAFKLAIQEEQWELASLYLLLGLMRTALSIPEDALPGLLEVLEGETNGREG